jgi:hypothetical protein
LQVPDLPEPIDTGKTSDELTEISNAYEGVATLSAEDVALMMRQLRDARSRIHEEVETCNALRKKLEQDAQFIDAHEQAITKGDQARVAFLTQQLEAHLLNVRAAEPNVKSIATPWGVILSRTQEPEYKRDDKLLLAWAEGYTFGDNHATPYVRVKETRLPDWDAIKRHARVDEQGRMFTPDGEQIAGVEVIQRAPKVTVEVTP